MKISEVAEITGLNISSIRFYERKGLLEPDRREDSKYRDYTPADVELVKKIVLYRKMDLSIEEIQTIINDNLDDREVVKKHLSELKGKREILNNSLVLCQMYLEDEEAVPDTDYYLGYVNQEEKQGKIYSKIDELYNDFEEFSKGTIFPDNSIISAFIHDKWRRRISVFIWSLIILDIPLVAMLHIGEERFLRIIIFWAIWCLFFFWDFHNFRVANKTTK